MSHFQWPAIRRCCVLLFGVLILLAGASKPVAAQSEYDSQYGVYYDDNNSEDDVYGYASLLAGSGDLEAYAMCWVTRYNPTLGAYGAMVDASLYIDYSKVGQDMDYSDGSGGSASIDWGSISAQPNQNIQFMVGYGLMDVEYYDWWFDLAWSDLWFTVEG